MRQSLTGLEFSACVQDRHARAGTRASRRAIRAARRYYAGIPGDETILFAAHRSGELNDRHAPNSWQFGMGNLSAPCRLWFRLAAAGRAHSRHPAVVPCPTPPPSARSPLPRPTPAPAYRRKLDGLGSRAVLSTTGPTEADEHGS